MKVLLPGTGRLTLVLFAIACAPYTYPWVSSTHRWVLGTAIAAVFLLLWQWRSVYLTTTLRRRLALVFDRSRRHTIDDPHAMHSTETDARTTVVLRVVDGVAPDLPLALIDSYLDRYGVRCQSLRITSRDTGGQRTTWISMTVSAAANLAALHARSHELRLRELAEITARRLVDQLREHGWSLTASEVGIPNLLESGAQERWRAVEDADNSYISAYGLTPDRFRETLAALWSTPTIELWTAIELTASGIAVACAIRTPKPPTATRPPQGLTSRTGLQRSALSALIPSGMKPLEAEVFPVTDLTSISWPATGVPVRA